MPTINPSEHRTLLDFIQLFIDIIDLLLPLVVGLSLLVFFKGLVSFMLKSGDSASHKEGKSLMLWGVIALFVMTSVFGILKFFYSDLGFSNPHSSNILPLLPQ
jgi:uncharacterized BrkB/YihY/UPF0761 family membrane protein